MGEVGHGISCSQVLCFPDFYTGNKKVAVSKDYTLEPIFKKVPRAPASCCHVKEMPNRTKSVSFELVQSK